MTVPEPPCDLSGWVARIRRRDMPVFGCTIEALCALLGDERASASKLAQVILKDAAMTAKVLRLANSAFFNQARQGVSTVSRAIVVLGFDPVAEIALSVTLIDALLSGGLKGRAQAEMARSFHAAVQARWAAARRGEAHGEEIFIAALLARVGEMAFWCFGGEQARSLDRCLMLPAMREEDAQLTVLGFHLRQLSMGLVREWKLGGRVILALEEGGRGRGAERAVFLGHRLARAAEEGWDCAASRQALRELADFVALPLAQVQAEVMANATEAARIAAAFGAPEVARGIPVGALTAPPELPLLAAPAGPDLQLQLHILHDLAAMTLGQARLVDILQLVLEGLFRGVGCERVVLAMVGADRLTLSTRAQLGQGGERLAAAFSFVLEGEPDDLIDAAIDSGQSFWLTPLAAQRPGAQRLRRASGSDWGFLAPFGHGAKQLGVFYADRAGKPLDEESWRAFQHFALQASLAVTVNAVF